MIRAMDSFSLEVSAYRIGGAEVGERVWGPWFVTVLPAHMQRYSVPGRNWPHQSLDLAFERAWVPVRPGLISTSVMLSSPDGVPLSTSRPVLVSMLPSDVPLYHSFVGRDPDVGVISLGLRIARSAWGPADLEAEAEAAVCPVVGVCNKPCPTQDSCAHVAARTAAVS